MRNSTAEGLLASDVRVSSILQADNNIRLNSAIGYITPKDILAGHQQEIHTDRKLKLAAARQQRQVRRQQGAGTHIGLLLG